jgi:lysophospholipase L1-like esterase
VLRLQSALAAPALVESAAFVDVTQSAAQATTPIAGTTATMIPTWAPTGSVFSLADAGITQLWGYRRDTWTRQAVTLNSLAPVSRDHPAATLNSRGVCGLHFEHTGRTFELLLAGTSPTIVLLADGRYMSPRAIRTAWSGGMAGAPLSNPNAFVQFDFGSPASRRLSVYAWSSQGPCSVAIAGGDSASGWDRSAEASMIAMTDSYGAAVSTRWGTGGPFWEAAALLGIVHLDLCAIGGTGYARNSANADTLNAGNAFGGRIVATSDAAPDLFITAGGVNDNNWLALAPYGSGAEARQGFDAAVAAYYRDLRAALPGSVLVALGPWTPPRDPSPVDVVQTKVQTIRSALQAVAGPWVFVDNINGGWLNSTGASSPATGVRWQTGRGWQGSPANDGGNSDLYVGPDGTHPNEAGCTYLAGQLAGALRAAIAAL